MAARGTLPLRGLVLFLRPGQRATTCEDRTRTCRVVYLCNVSSHLTVQAARAACGRTPRHLGWDDRESTRQPWASVSSASAYEAARRCLRGDAGPHRRVHREIARECFLHAAERPIPAHARPLRSTLHCWHGRHQVRRHEQPSLAFASNPLDRWRDCERTPYDPPPPPCANADQEPLTAAPASDSRSCSVRSTTAVSRQAEFPSADSSLCRYATRRAALHSSSSTRRRLYRRPTPPSSHSRLKQQSQFSMSVTKLFGNK